MKTLLSTSLGVKSTAERGTQVDIIHANSDTYEWLAGKVQSMDRREDVEIVLRWVEKAARFACKFHPGRFADGSIENVALKIGEELDTVLGQTGGEVGSVDHKESRRRILHVATLVSAIGGHTRMLYHWVRNDHTSRHSVVLVNQDLPIPTWLFEAVRNSGGELIIFPPRLSLCSKATWLRQIARRSADLVVLHHHAFDVVPTLAFAVHACPPVVVLNHADHQFWLGSSVSDLVSA